MVFVFAGEIGLQLLDDRNAIWMGLQALAVHQKLSAVPGALLGLSLRREGSGRAAKPAQSSKEVGE